MAAQAVKSANWIRLGRRSLQFSLWMVMFVLELLILMGYFVAKICKSNSSYEIKEDLFDAKNVNNYVNPRSPLYENDVNSSSEK